jgi:hypothetical protein
MQYSASQFIFRYYEQPVVVVYFECTYFEATETSTRLYRGETMVIFNLI